MFSKFMKFFEVKPDVTLDYMDPDILLKRKKRVLQDPLNQEDEDEFFRQLEKDEQFVEHENIRKEPHQIPQNDAASRESVLKKMRQCMQERDWNPKHHPRIVVTIACVVIGSVLVAMVLYEAPNPLIGKWKPQGKNVFPPTGDIDFFKEKVQMMGVHTLVKYKIDHSMISVIDPITHTSITFVLKDDKNIESNLLGVKTSYKKVDK